MVDQHQDEHLSRIQTLWSVVRDAHAEGSHVAAAQEQLIERYSGAVYRYLLALVRDADAADDLFQEFALRVIRGGFHNAEPGKGRFRDYLKTAVSRLAIDHHRRRPRRGVPLIEPIEPAADEPPPAEDDRLFVESWRDELLARTWSRLSHQQREQSVPYFSILRIRARNPGASSHQLAEFLTAEVAPPVPFNDAQVRKILQRSREKFAEILIDEVAQSLDEPSASRIEEELIDLALFEYCKPVLQRRK